MKTILIFCSLFILTGFHSNGQAYIALENIVVYNYNLDYHDRTLMTIVNGYMVKLNPSKHKVYIDTILIPNDDLSFFEDKYPDFIAPLLSETNSVDSILLQNNSASLNDFKFARAAEFLKNRSKYKEGDISISISRAFYFKGAYYVHAWLLNHDKNYFHHKRCTFKFDQQKVLIGKSCENHYQTSYSGAKKYLESIGAIEVDN